jgi:transcriptional regulator
VSPQWYASKRAHGRVVPTWNYAMVQVRGTARVIEDRDWLLAQISRLTDRHEPSVKDGKPWQVGDAPADFITAQLKGIVGLTITVRELTGKLKVSQNRSAADRAGVVDGLQEQGGEGAISMADLVRDQAR